MRMKWSFRLALLLCAALMPALYLAGTAAAETATVRIDYVNRTYDKASGTVIEETKTAEAMPIPSDTTWNAGWYVVNSDVTISKRITVIGDVHLILADGCVLTASKGINVAEGNSLTIYAQSEGGRAGALTAEGGTHQAGIGGGDGEDSGPITINGGKVTATGGLSGAGIGGGYHGDGSNITINGGTVKATGGKTGAGIGGGNRGSGSNITINGGSVTASSLEYGAGIGGGSDSSNGGSGSNITINGGTVTATGGYGGAGIGGGDNANGSAITITGGTVTATGGYGGASIGGGQSVSGKYGDGSYITITGGTVTATGGKYGAGIGGGQYGDGSDITITGGFVTAQGGSAEQGYGSGAAIGDGGDQGDNNNGDETSEDQFTNCVVLRRPGSASEMSGKAYGEAVVTADATVPDEVTVTVPQGALVRVSEGATLTVDGKLSGDGTVKVDGALRRGVNGSTDGVRELYQLTVNGGVAAPAGAADVLEEETGEATADSSVYYAAPGANVVLTAKETPTEGAVSWQPSLNSASISEDGRFIMPQSVLAVTAKWEAAPPDEPDEPDEPGVPDVPDVPDEPGVPVEPVTPVEPVSPSYTITLQSGGNGKVSASALSAAEGTEITLTATPDKGFVFKEWQVVSGKAIIRENKFVMPAGDVVIKAVFERPAPPPQTGDSANPGWWILAICFSVGVIGGVFAAKRRSGKKR